MTPQELKAEHASNVMKAFEDGKLVQFRARKSCLSFSPTWTNANRSLEFNFEHYEYRIAKEHHIGTIGDHQAFINSDALHVGCTAISFERVRQIAKACREWTDGKQERLKRFFILPKTESNTECSYGYKSRCEAEGHGVPTSWRIVEMREVLPGEDDV